MPVERKLIGRLRNYETGFDTEIVWGGDRSDWANWRTATPKENLDLAGYMIEQKKAMLGEETRKAYAEDFVRKIWFYAYAGAER